MSKTVKATITNVTLQNGIVNIYAKKRNNHSVVFNINTTNIKEFMALRNWMRGNKKTLSCKTWGAALHAIIGTEIEIKRAA